MFRESVRDKVLYNLVASHSPIGASRLGQLTADRMSRSSGPWPGDVFGLFIAVHRDRLLSKEVERKSVYSLLPKPIHRYQLIVGKYAGLALTLVVNMAIMTVALYGVLLYMAWGVDPAVQRAWDAPALDPALLKAIALILVSLLLVTAIALFFSTFSAPLLAALTFGFSSGSSASSPELRSGRRLGRGVLARGWVLPNCAIRRRRRSSTYAVPAHTADDGLRFVSRCCSSCAFFFSDWRYGASAGLLVARPVSRRRARVPADDRRRRALP